MRKMKEHLIPAVFEVPVGYRREFIFEDAVTGFRHQMVVEPGGIRVSSSTGPGPENDSTCLDWIAVSIMAVREELGV